jgi:hypothetical protein
MSDHPERDVFNPFEGQEIRIDVELALLLPRMWQRGIRTTACCQDAGLDWREHEGKAYVVFPTVYDAERFLAIAAGSFSEELESLYNRVVFHGASVETEDNWVHRRRFTVEGWASDLNRDYVESEEGGDDVAVVYGPPRIELSIAVYFPRDDIAALERRFVLPTPNI